VQISKHDIIIPAGAISPGGPCVADSGCDPVVASVVLGAISHGGFFTSVRMIQGLVWRIAHKKVSRNCVHRTLLHLMARGYINRIYRGSYKSRKASIYQLTYKYQLLLKSSDRFYHSLSDIRNCKGSFSNEDQRVKHLTGPKVTAAVDFHSDWRNILPESLETDHFITALSALEANQVCFRRLNALREADSLSGFHQTYPLKPGNIQIAYKPTVTGRLQSVPHTFIGKDLSRFFRPAEDPDLEKGFLFSLDYSQQELRLLAYHCKDSSMLRYANDGGNMFKQMIGQLQMHPSIRKCSKGAIYSFIYGSDGWALKSALDKEFGFDPKHLKYARKFGADLRQLYPSINQLQQELETKLMDDRLIIAPGGVQRVVDEKSDAVTNKGLVSKRWVRRTALSHTIQGSGAWITRKVVAAAVNLKESRLFMPVHDGFIFYSQSDNAKEAVSEAKRLMESCAKEVAPYIQIPAKVEWSIGRNSELV